MFRYLAVVCLVTTVGCASLSPPPLSNGFEQAPWSVARAGDLATAGLGLAGLRGPAPELDDPLQPTATALRQLAVWTNYRALVDVSAGGGFTEAYGPQGLAAVPGREYRVLSTHPTKGSHVVVVQLPDALATASPCLVAAPASGSRGPLGAIGAVADWALRRGCVVVMTDKGAGPWLSVGEQAGAFAIDGRWQASVGDEAVREPFSVQRWRDQSHRVGLKHAHSGRNPEAHWGAFVLDSIAIARRIIEVDTQLDTAVLWTLAAGVSNGGAAVLQAAEQDRGGRLIDAVVAAAPNVHVQTDLIRGLTWREQDGHQGPVVSQPLIEWSTLAGLLEPCATTAEAFAAAPMAFGQAPIFGALQARCRWLEAGAYLTPAPGLTTADAALAALNAAGAHPAALPAMPFNTVSNVFATINAIYLSAYERTNPTAMACGVTMGRLRDGSLAPLDLADLAAVAATNSGVPPVAGAELLVQGDITDFRPLGQADAYGAETAACWRQHLQQSSLASVPAQWALAANPTAPTIVLHGRSDALIWVNPTSRAYFAANQRRHAARSTVRYIELTHVQHFDALLGLPGFNTQFIPMQAYFERALDAQWAHRFDQEPLPVSQVIETVPRQVRDGTVEPLSDAHLPMWRFTAAGIVLRDNVLAFDR